MIVCSLQIFFLALLFLGVGARLQKPTSEGVSGETVSVPLPFLLLRWTITSHHLLTRQMCNLALGTQQSSLKRHLMLEKLKNR